MEHLLQQLAQRPASPVAAGGLSVSGAAVSLTAATQVVQLFAGVIAVVSGVIGIAIGLWHLKEIWKKEHQSD